MSARSLILVGLLIGLLASAAAAQSLRYTRIGTNPGESYGSAVAALSDINGDGFDEIIVGAENYNGALGKVQIIDGRGGSVIWEHLGEVPGDRFGAVVAAIGDIDGDGSADVLIGAPRQDLGGLSTDAGRVYVFSGDSGTLIRMIDGPGPNARYGSALADVGDQNGDGVRDFAIGAPQAAAPNSNAGVIEVRSGADGSLLWSVAGASGNRLGAAVVAADVNGDGFLDVVGGATHVATNGSLSGRVTAFAFGTGAALGYLNGAAAGDQFGRTLANMGDLDGDGRDDLAVGAPLADPAGADSGRVVIVSLLASTILATFDGSQAGENLGQSISAGDIAFDGRRDLLIGAPGYSGTHGALSGRLIVASADGTVRKELFGNDAGDQFGNACAYLLRGRSGAAFVVGAWRDDLNLPPNADNGMVTVFDFDRTAHPVVVEFLNVEFGEYGMAAVLPDVDGDGRSDIIRTSYGNAVIGGLHTSGAVELLSGKTGERIWKRFGAPFSRLGTNAAAVGDQNQDGIVDIAVADGTGSVKIISGQDGAELGFTVDASGLGFYGTAMTQLDDMDGDGIREFLVTRAATSALGPAGRLDFHHGGDFALMNSVTMPNAPIGAFCELFIDKDGDGKRDLLVGAELLPVGTIGQPHAFVVSSATGAVLATFDFGGQVLTNFPYAVPRHSFAILGDIDGDGVDDFAGIQASISHIYSGATYLPIYGTVENGVATAAGDVNGDGRADFYVTTASGIATEPVLLRLFSGADHSVLASRNLDIQAYGIPSSIHDVSDFDGDGFSDVLMYDESGNSGVARVSRSAAIVSLVGGSRFGDSLDRPRGLSLDWSPSAGGIAPTGSVVTTGAPGFAPGIIGVSAVRERSVFAGEVILLPVDPVETLSYFFGFDAVGEAQFVVDLRQPALAGQSLYLQTFGFDGSLPLGLASSNGLSLSFIN